MYFISLLSSLPLGYRRSLWPPFCLRFFKTFSQIPLHSQYSPALSRILPFPLFFSSLVFFLREFWSFSNSLLRAPFLDSLPRSVFPDRWGSPTFQAWPPIGPLGTSFFSLFSQRSPFQSLLWDPRPNLAEANVPHRECSFPLIRPLLYFSLQFIYVPRAEPSVFSKASYFSADCQISHLPLFDFLL